MVVEKNSTATNYEKKPILVCELSERVEEGLGVISISELLTPRSLKCLMF